MNTAAAPHYLTLGVQSNATAREIREAYRRLAKRHHPDANAGNPTAEERFKAISVAYQVLGDPAARRQYDRAFAAARDSRKTDAKKSSATPGRNVKIILHLTLEEAAKGGSRKLRYPRDTICLGCIGSGRAARNTGECRSCKGSGRVTQDHSATVHFKRGVRADDLIRIVGAGHNDPEAGTAGDLVVAVKYKKHPYLTVKGAELHYETLINLEQYMEGGKVRIPTLAGVIALEVAPRFPDGGTVRLQGKGLPATNGNPAGDLIVTLRHCLPKRLSSKEKSVLAELLKLPGFNPMLDRDGLLPREGAAE